jgi:hypothetical protein
MPTGSADTLTPVAQFVEWLQPGRVLDVGVGAGRMGVIARQYGNLSWLRVGRDDGIVVDGIEGYEPYLGPIQRAVYDEIFVGEANATLAKMVESGTRYDLVIAAEILEHFTREDGATFLRRCLALGDVLLVTTPSWYFDQTIGDNSLETHRSFWSPADLRRAGAQTFLHRGLANVCVLGNAEVISAYLDAHRPTRPRWYQWVLPRAWEQLLRQARAELRERRERKSSSAPRVGPGSC